MFTMIGSLVGAILGFIIGQVFKFALFLVLILAGITTVVMCNA